MQDTNSRVNSQTNYETVFYGYYVGHYVRKQETKNIKSARSICPSGQPLQSKITGAAIERAGQIQACSKIQKDENVSKSPKFCLAGSTPRQARLGRYPAGFPPVRTFFADASVAARSPSRPLPWSTCTIVTCGGRCLAMLRSSIAMHGVS